MGITFKIILLFIATVGVQSFYIYLTNETSQCFYNNIFRDEQLLVEVQTPIISTAHKIVMIVKNNDQIVLEKDIINLAKIVVPRASNQINDRSDDTQFQYETCFKVEAYKDSENQAENAAKQPQANNAAIPEGYFLSIKLMTNFSHLLQSNVESIQKSNVDYKQIEKISDRLLQINTQQITLHQINEVKQKLSQSYIQALKEKIIMYSMIEIIMILIFTSMQVKLMKGYVSDLSII